ncbi:MAG: 50S ribosomal protein L15 [Nitrososphaerota archaeon]
MPTRLRKVRKLRGSRTHGWGTSGQHRKAGGRGGRGKAGLHKHKWQYTLKYMPEHFGKDPMRPPRRRVERAINVGELDDLFYRLTGRAPPKEERATLDLRALGYTRLLGGGWLKGRYEILVGSASSRAKEKVEKVGGTLVIG